jgi:hypothetical protein
MSSSAKSNLMLFSYLFLFMLLTVAERRMIGKACLIVVDIHLSG